MKALREFFRKQFGTRRAAIVADQNTFAVAGRSIVDAFKQAGHGVVEPFIFTDPALHAEGKNPLILDSKAPSIPLEQYAYNETRYRMLLQSNEARAESLMQQAKQDVQDRWHQYQQLATEDGHQSS